MFHFSLQIEVVLIPPHWCILYLLLHVAYYIVMKESPDYGFLAYQGFTIPRGPRSIRKRRPRKQTIEDGQVCAFELLAALAGKLLQESESSASSNAEGKDQLGILGDGFKFEDHKAFRSESRDPGSCVESAFMSGSAVREPNSKSSLRDTLHLGDESVLKHTSNTTDTDLSKDINLDLKLEICTSNSVERNLPDRMEGISSKDGKLCDNQRMVVDDGLVDKNMYQGDFVAPNRGSRNVRRANYVNNNTVINSEHSVQLQSPLCKDPIPSASFAKHRNNVKFFTARDDDNYFLGNNTKIKAFRPESRFGYRRIRKILTSKYWKVAPTLKDSESSDCFEGMKPFYHQRRSFHSSERIQRQTPSKRVKLCNNDNVLASDDETSSESISNSPEKGVKRDNNDSTPFLLGAIGRSASLKSLQQSGDARVKLSIKSFKVPELYIEVPETATIGSLKRTVMEAVTTILGGGLDVGVVLQGKKMRDDNRTLQQAGISDCSNLETLGFTLEPCMNQVAHFSPKKPSPLLSQDADQRLPRSPDTPNLELGLLVPSSSNDPPTTKIGKPVDDKLELGLPLRAQAEACSGKAVKDSKALVPMSTLNVEPLAVVPLNQKCKRSEFSQRRTRRPFSVNEVEALVEAVETLGTGRWRDVKMRAFDNAGHRTYVDLKDKWKTLVHTASISPQQRRGEPVPQQLLDRVLCAHGYWSQHQSKQHGKHHVEPLKIFTDGQAERVGA
ncbi:hypothetical protein LIER_34700 [Lithospermum erythrorhizon]|uniref:Uncharacterized protein n=1 Tax=Lithospermum erythrorhizon TaxID=34254 RepID=A0AAV3S3M3_LITER